MKQINFIIIYFFKSDSPRQIAKSEIIDINSIGLKLADLSNAKLKPYRLYCFDLKIEIWFAEIVRVIK